MTLPYYLSRGKIDMDPGTVLYAKQGTRYILKFVGDIRYPMSCSLEDFLEQLFARDDYDDILLDLTETTAIDSTCLGLLAKVTNFTRDRFNRKTTLVSVQEDVNHILDSMGFYTVFNICDDYEIVRQDYQTLPNPTPDKAMLTETLYEAHRTLSDLNEQNRVMFEDVMEALKKKIDS
jgi:anti-anti-sigma factor